MAGYILHPVGYILRRLVKKRKTGGARPVEASLGIVTGL